MAGIVWLRDPDRAFEHGRATGKMILLDFSAAPM
jgi:hypothetical protein